MSSELKADTMTGSRRTFLKATGFAAIGSAIGTPAVAGAAAVAGGQGGEASAEASASQTPVEMVNLLQGADSTPVFSRGNTLPIAAMPFGMGHWTLQSRANSPSMFQSGDRRIQGFRCTHQLSPWLSDYGYASFLPFSGDINPESGPRASSQSRSHKAVLSQMPALLLELWREQHPLGHEQTTLDFKAKYPAANTAPLFLDRLTGHSQTNTL
jgi:putative alpha-1,2-mannosidase